MSKAKPHGNSGFRVVNLHHTKHCPHKLQSGSWFDHVETKAKYCASLAKCHSNGRKKLLSSDNKRGCHVIAANQNTATGKRFILPLCAECNGKYDTVLDVKVWCQEAYLPNCNCGHIESPIWNAKKCAQCKIAKQKQDAKKAKAKTQAPKKKTAMKKKKQVVLKKKASSS